MGYTNTLSLFMVLFTLGCIIASDQPLTSTVSTASTAKVFKLQYRDDKIVSKYWEILANTTMTIRDQKKRMEELVKDKPEQVKKMLETVKQAHENSVVREYETALTVLKDLKPVIENIRDTIFKMETNETLTQRDIKRHINGLIASQPEKHRCFLDMLLNPRGECADKVAFLE